MIDDQRPKLLEDLGKQGFSIDYDSTGDDTSKIEKNLYDLILLDFGGVGERFGKDEGLSLLRHIRRVNPAPFILAYTSKSLTSAQSDFYRMTDATLSKDAGIEESFSKIETSLREALNLERVWNALLTVGARDERSKKEMDRVLTSALKRRNIDLLSEHLHNRIGSAGNGELVDKLIGKMLDLLGKAIAQK